MPAPAKRLMAATCLLKLKIDDGMVRLYHSLNLSPLYNITSSGNTSVLKYTMKRKDFKQSMNNKHQDNQNKTSIQWTPGS